MPADRYSAVARTSATEEVRRQLVELVETGELAVGEKLPPETDLARAFGVSRPVVREAMGVLRAVGILRSRPGYGSVVASRRGDALLLLGRHTYEELYEVRCKLEIPGAAEAARRRMPKQVERLSDLIEQLERMTEVPAWVDLDTAFHVALANATGNRVLVRLVEDLRDLMTEHSLRAAELPGRRQEANCEHRAIYDAVAAMKAPEARRAMKRHLENVERRLRVEVGV
jgi:GntR family transcriptional regulator, transcriptional repressor for pyruvate dehydrogenase complex